MEEIGNVLQLRDVVRRVATVLLEKRENVVVLATGIRGVKLTELRVDGLPGLDLLFGIFHAGNGLSGAIGLGHVDDLAPTLPVFRVQKARMIRVELLSKLQGLLREAVQVLQLAWKPGDFYLCFETCSAYFYLYL